MTVATRNAPPPTEQQQHAVELARAGKDLAIEALAGTGKTTTLVHVARALRGEGQYLAFNRAIVDDARAKFGQNVRCNTAHSLAFRAVGSPFADRLRGSRMTHWQYAKWLGNPALTVQTGYGRRHLEAKQVAGLARRTAQQFCKSADLDLGETHVPDVFGFGEPWARQALVEATIPLARRLWNDLSDPNGELPCTHDTYLKVWQLGKPTIARDYLLFDEAQDADPVMLTVVNDQDAQLIYSGDRYQAIYEWRGAVNALEFVNVDAVAPLTQSFRFGPSIAAQANRFLIKLEAPYEVQGDRRLRSTVGPLPLNSAHAVLCRTNGGVVSNIIECLSRGVRPAVVGGVNELIEFAEACAELIAGRRTGHRDLAPFLSWDEVMSYVEAHPDEAQEVASMARLVDRYRPAKLISLLRQCVSEEAADIVISTAHRSKGREWRAVRVHGDFLHINDMDTQDLRLGYVAVTRAREHLDLEAWNAVVPRRARVRDGGPVPAPPAAPSPRPPARAKRPPIGSTGGTTQPRRGLLGRVQPQQ
jgi:hypothetical protein